MKSLDKILTNFRKVQTELSDYIKYHHDAAEYKAADIALLHTQMMEHQVEKEKAQRIYNNFHNLLNEGATQNV